MSKVQVSAERTPHDLGRFVVDCSEMGRLKVIDATPVSAGDSYSCDMVGVVRLSPLRRGLAIDSKVDIVSFYIPHRHIYGDAWIEFLKKGVSADPLPAAQLKDVGVYTGGALGMHTGGALTNPKAPLWLFRGYVNIYNEYFRMPEGNPMSYSQEDWTQAECAYGLPVCHLKNIWTAPLPRDITSTDSVDVSGGTLDIMGLNAAYAKLHTEQERDFFMRRYRDVVQNFGGSTHYDGDKRPHMLMRSEFWASGYDVDGTDQTSLGQFSGRVQQSFNHKVPRFFVPEHGSIITVMVNRFPPIHTKATPYYCGQPEHTYADIANDPAITGNMPPRRVESSSIFRGGVDGYGFLLAEGQWMRSIPDYVHPAYSELDGFPFIDYTDWETTQSPVIRASAYDKCFQTLQLRHWNIQMKTNVTVLRALPTAREAILTSA